MHTSDEASRAQEALDGADQARRDLAERITAPWWYHVGAALAVTATFIGFGLIITGPDTVGMVVLVLGGIVGPAVLVSALRRATGVSFDRYARGLGLWTVIVFGLLAIAFPLQVWGGVAVAFPIAGVLAGIVTLWRERRIDELLYERFTGGAASV